MQNAEANRLLRTGETHVLGDFQRSSTGASLVDVFVFIIPSIHFVQVRLVGVLNGSDLLLLASAIYLVARGRIEISSSTGRWLISLCSLWLAAQCVTDIVRHTAFVDYARGWSNIGITIVNLSVIWTLLYDRPRRIVIYGWGLVTGGLLTFFINPDDFMVDYPWKFGLALPATLGVFLLVSRMNWRSRSPFVAMFAIGLFNIYMGSRNRGGACLAAFVYVAITHFLGHNGKAATKLRARTVIAICASVALGAVSVFWIYQLAATGGLLGPSAKEEYARQSSGRYGLLIGGRTEMFASIPAIYDSPILGHGSWAKDPSYLIAERQALALMGYEDAMDVTSDELEEGLIPSHSYLFGAWVNAGVVGALFWAWVLALVVRALMHVYPRFVRILPLMSFAAFSLLWDILFSPYGATSRIVVPYYLVIIVTCMSMVSRENVTSVS